jgi:hypothetical protein
MLEVLDREAKRLVALQEAVEHRPAHRPQVGAASLRGNASVQVVLCGQRPQLLQQL